MESLQQQEEVSNTTTKRRTKEERKALCELYKKESSEEFAKRHSIHPATFQNWLREFEAEEKEPAVKVSAGNVVVEFAEKPSNQDIREILGGEDG